MNMKAKLLSVAFHILMIHYHSSLKTKLLENFYFFFNYLLFLGKKEKAIKIK